MLIAFIVPGMIATVVFFYNYTPVVFINLLYISIDLAISYVSTSGVIRLLSVFLFGKFITGMIETQGDVPAICVASCK